MCFMTASFTTTCSFAAGGIRPGADGPKRVSRSSSIPAIPFSSRRTTNPSKNSTSTTPSVTRRTSGSHWRGKRTAMQAHPIPSAFSCASSRTPRSTASPSSQSTRMSATWNGRDWIQMGHCTRCSTAQIRRPSAWKKRHGATRATATCRHCSTASVSPGQSGRATYSITWTSLLPSTTWQ